MWDQRDIPRQGAPGPDEGLQRLVDAARRLFAGLGFDGVTTEMIAEAAGTDVATVRGLAGGKRELYLDVMDEAASAERRALDECQSLPPDRDDSLRSLDHYIDFYVAHPEVAALWVHRWLSDARDITEVESRFLRPTLEKAVQRIAEIAPNVDAEYVLWTIIWSVQGFATSGVLDADGGRRGVENPAQVERFRRHLHSTTRQMLGMAVAQ
ncbi:TetR/AcrR family transcriptional regulator [Actinomadura rupiterrae]|uniref:TetR/AcrR family transcriptional regulator n=1 Tax=Actinomadura rupiterrae TaxID=559627 RepID=UPI0020A5D3CB|nr:TetR/AcrR family transcriptional regulator [Actinomadura rupiterrae]MCP2342821.1 AcrR family transcriptional regulator [Actinomadura rupiterrae]